MTNSNPLGPIVHDTQTCTCAACSTWKARRYLIQQAAARKASRQRTTHLRVNLFLAACFLALCFSLGLRLPILTEPSTARPTHFHKHALLEWLASPASQIKDR